MLLKYPHGAGSLGAFSSPKRDRSSKSEKSGWPRNFPSNSHILWRVTGLEASRELEFAKLRGSRLHLNDNS